MGGDALALAVANHRRFGCGKGHQRANRAFGARFLEEAEQGVQHDDEQDDDGLVGQGGLARVLQQPFDHRDDGGDEQDDHQEVLELLDQPCPPGCFRGALELVRTVSLKASLRLGSAQAACKVGAERRDHRLRRRAMGRDRKAFGQRGAVSNRGTRACGFSISNGTWADGF